MDSLVDEKSSDLERMHKSPEKRCRLHDSDFGSRYLAQFHGITETTEAGPGYYIFVAQNISLDPR